MKARVNSLFVEERMMGCWLMIGQRGTVHWQSYSPLAQQPEVDKRANQLSLPQRAPTEC